MSDPWVYGIQFKDKPNSQGTLFRSGDKANLNPSRWPRGYTPERQRQVRSALGVGSPNAYDDERWAERLSRGGTDASGNAHRAAVDTIARSTVPISDLKGGLDVIPGSARTLMNGTLGEYEPKGRWGGRIDLAHGEESTETLIHEIGHHVQGRQQGRKMMREGTGSSRADGRLEGEADRYAVTHFRDRRGKPLDSLGEYNVAGRTPEFRAGYWQGRGDAGLKEVHAYQKPPPKQLTFPIFPARKS